MKALKKLVAVLALSLPLATFAQEAAKPAEPPKPTVTPYGFILLNAFWDANTFSAKDYPAQAAHNQNGGAFLMSARQSRFGVKLAMNDENWTGAALTGVIEFDFKAGHLPACTAAACTAPTSSNGWNAGLMRLRLAAMTASWKTGFGNVSVLAGQDYGLVNPLFATSLAWVADPIFWQAGNLWRRSPQIRAQWNNTFDMIGVTVQAAMLSPADNTPAPQAGYTIDNGAGNRSRQPDLEARAALSVKVDANLNGTIGVGYHTNKRRYDSLLAAPATSAPTTDITATLLGVDADINVPFANIRGEYFDGKGTDDTYNGIAASGVRNTAAAGADPTYEKVGSKGYWAQAVIKPIPEIWVTVGYGNTKLDNLAAAGAAASTTRTENTQIEGGVIVNAGKYWKFGVEACQTTTKYNDTTATNKQDAMQVALSSMLTF